MILAAGEGSRLHPLTADRPKPMIPIAGVPILEHNVRRLVQHGFNEIVINVHHRGDVIESHIGDGARFGATIHYSREERLLGTAGGVRRAMSLLGDRFLVVYGDNLSLCDFSALFVRHVESAAWMTMALYHREDPTSSGIVEVDAGWRVRRFLEKPSPHEVFSNWVNGGVLALDARVMDLIPENQPCDFGRDVVGALLALGAPVTGFPMGPDLWWIDTLDDYERTARVFADAKAAARLYENPSPITN
jgi:NDP-sugar pyrophosphorylase family protein